MFIAPKPDYATLGNAEMREEFSTTAPNLFWYRQSPVSERSFQILQLHEQQGYMPVGDYTILDRSESVELAEKKLQNIISLMNGRERVVDLSEACAGTRTLYQLCPRSEDSEKQRIILRTFDGQHVSRETALLQIEARLWAAGEA